MGDVTTETIGSCAKDRSDEDLEPRRGWGEGGWVTRRCEAAIFRPRRQSLARVCVIAGRQDQ